MKLTAKILFAIAFPAIFFSCKKNDNNGPTKLVRFDYKNSTSTWSNSLNYNADNKITSIVYNQNNGTTLPIFQVTYSGNQAIIARNESDANIAQNSTITFTLDAEGKPLKRLLNYYVELKSAQQKDYKFDTLTYEYDAAGLLTKVTRSGYDSTTSGTSSVFVSVSVFKGVTNYTTTAGNLVSSNNVTTNTGYNIQVNGKVTWKETKEDNYAYEYTKSYPNKTDFSNSTILNEYGTFYFLLNKNYKNIPDKVKYSSVTKDVNTGSTMYSSNEEYNIVLEYNNKGLLSTISYPSYPNNKTTLIYGR